MGRYVKPDIKEHLKGLVEHLQEHIPESDDSYNFAHSSIVKGQVDT